MLRDAGLPRGADPLTPLIEIGQNQAPMKVRLIDDKTLLSAAARI